MVVDINDENVYHHLSSSERDGEGITIYVCVKTGSIVVADEEFLSEHGHENYIYIGCVQESETDEDLLLFEEMYDDDDSDGEDPLTEDDLA